MRRFALAVSLIALVLPSAVLAEGFNLAWNDCLHGSGQTTHAFACDTDAGSHTLVASVIAPPGVGQWTAFEAAMTFHSTSAAMPDWWRLRNQTGQLGQCRNGALSANAIGAGLTGCTDPYEGQGGGGIGSYLVGPNGQPQIARLLMVFAVPPGSERPLNEGEEYFVSKVVITNAKTTGPTGCQGCPDGACIVMEYVKVVQPAGAPGGDQTVSIWNESPGVTWQNTQLSITDCGVSCYEPGKPSLSNCAICRTVNASWSRIKAIYR